MIKKNVDVRKAAKDSGVFLWEIEIGRAHV